MEENKTMASGWAEAEMAEGFMEQPQPERGKGTPDLSRKVELAGKTVRHHGYDFTYCTRDGGTMARTPEQLRDDLLAAGWESAVMLDGGGSSQCDFAGQQVESGRAVHDLILVYLKKEGSAVEKTKTVVLDAGHDASNLANRSPDGAYYGKTENHPTTGSRESGK